VDVDGSSSPITLDSYRLTILNRIAGSNVYWGHVPDARNDLSALAVENVYQSLTRIDRANDARHRRGNINIPRSWSCRQARVLKHEIFDQKHLRWAERASGIAISALCFELLNFTPNDSIGTSPGILDVDRNATLKSRMLVADWMMSNKLIQIVNQLIA
jgi:hypothetical protein